jgi:hypothetical protein
MKATNVSINFANRTISLSFGLSSDIATADYSPTGNAKQLARVAGFFLRFDSKRHQSDTAVGYSIVKVSSDCGAGSIVPSVVRLLRFDSQGCECCDKKKDDLTAPTMSDLKRVILSRPSSYIFVSHQIEVR